MAGSGIKRLKSFQLDIPEGYDVLIRDKRLKTGLQLPDGVWLNHLLFGDRKR